MFLSVHILHGHDTNVDSSPNPLLENKIFFPGKASFGSVIHTPLASKSMKSVGLQWARYVVSWNDIKQNKGSYNFTKLDRVINDFNNNHLNIILVFNLYDMNLANLVRLTNESIIDENYNQFIKTLVQRYKGKINIWEIGNEPEGDPNRILTNPQQYTLLARNIAKIITRIEPKAHIAALSTAWMDRPFITECLKNGLLADKTIDIISFHGYSRETILPESGLSSDVAWLRNMIAKHKPPEKDVIIIDSERGYAIQPFLSPKHQDSYRNIVYSEEEQAAYLARHYLEEIYLGIEVSIWYKDMWGEDSFSLFEQGPNSRVRPIGHVMTNLSKIFVENPKEIVNDHYPVTITSKHSKVDSIQKENIVLRSYLIKKNKWGRSEKLVIALWNPIEFFNERILESRTRKGDYFFESWKKQKNNSSFSFPVSIIASNIIKNKKIKKISMINLLEKEKPEVKELNFKINKDQLLLSLFKINPSPTIIEIEIL
jgi:hypothetical protein